MNITDLFRLAYPVLGLAVLLASGCGKTSAEPDDHPASGGDASQMGSGGASSSGGWPGAGGSDQIPDGLGGSIELFPYFTCGNTEVYGPDEDGDGYADPSDDGRHSAAEWIVLGCQTSVPDCDDSAPTKHLTGFVDEDGDELGDLERPICIEGTAPPNGVVLNFLDCDDEDEAKLELGLVDADGDGFGQARVCLAEEPTALPWTDHGDCDDEDIDAHPDAPDVPGDGQDTNCDEADGVMTPLGGFHEVLRGVEQVPTDDPCESTADLRIHEFWQEDFFCAGQEEPHPIRTLVAVGNRGNGPAPSATLLMTSVLDEDWQLELPVPALDAQATTPLYALGRVPYEITIQIRPSAALDCEGLRVTYSATGMCSTR